MNDHEFDKLKLFFQLYMKWFIPANQKVKNPEKHLESFFHKLPASDAKKGLKMAVNDIVEMSYEWPFEKVLEADQRFLNAGTYGLSHVRKMYSRRFKKLLKKKSIDSDYDLYFLKGILDDRNLSLNEEEKTHLQQLINVYSLKMADTPEKYSLGKKIFKH